jgi:hypothetical protein
MFTYDEKLNKVLWDNILFNVFLPKDKIDFYLELFNSIDTPFMLIENIEHYQSQKPNFPGHQIADYCLYLGTYNNFDLYSVGSWHDHYTTGIVFGNEDSEYMSGWIELRDTREEYEELFKRECVCGIVGDNVMLQLGRNIVANTAQKELMNIIKQLRANRNAVS